jgi:hypothetical protein
MWKLLKVLPHLRRAVDAQEELAFHAEHVLGGKRVRTAGFIGIILTFSKTNKSVFV